MSQDISYLLSEWAKWCAGMNRTGLGFPSKAPYAEERTARTADTAPRVTDPDVERIDRILTRQPCLLPMSHRQVIVTYYLGTGSVKDRMRRLNLQHRRFYELLDHGKAMLEALLDAERVT